MSKKKPLKQFPTFKTDEEAEEFVATADLSEYDFSGFRPISEFFDFRSLRKTDDAPVSDKPPRKKASWPS